MLQCALRVAGKAGHTSRNRRIVHPGTVRCSWGARPRKNYESHIDASLSRQPLVKGERLVRYEVNAVMAVQRLSSPRLGRMRNNCHMSLAGRLRPPTCYMGIFPVARRGHGNAFRRCARDCSRAWCAAVSLGAELLPRRVRRNQPSAMPVRRARVLEQARRIASPQKN